MKKYFLVLIATLTMLTAHTSTNAERKIWMHSNSGNHIGMNINDFDSISFKEPTLLVLSEYDKKLDSKGGSFNLGIHANQAWKAETNNPIALSLSKTTGTGEDYITVTAIENTGTKSYSAIITVTSIDGIYQQLIVTVLGTERGSLKINPEVVNLSSAGGEFILNIETNQDWAAKASDPHALKLTNASGSGNATINISAVPNADSEPYTEYATVELADGTKKQLAVNVSVSNEYVHSNLDYGKTVNKKGELFEASVYSNTIWAVKSDRSWMTVSPDTGKYLETITVNVEGNPNVDDEYGTLTFTALGGATTIAPITREGDKISISPSFVNVKNEGENINVTVSSNTEWTAIADKDWVVISTDSGKGDNSIIVNIKSATQKSTRDSSIVTFTTLLGKIATIKIFRLAYTGVGEIITDINNNSYSTVWINGQNWMAENLKCNKYDTKSEAYYASWLTDNTIPTTSESVVFTPYYTDATNKNKWYSTEYSSHLSNEQMAKLGYLYNWSAAVGVSDGNEQTVEFSGNRQGICPNGWHVPTNNDWQTLFDYIYQDQQLSNNVVGKYLKTTLGWYDSDNPEMYPQGLDSYNFAALPSGKTEGNVVEYVGAYTYFWTSTKNNRDAYSRKLSFGANSLEKHTGINADTGLSVRCLKD